MTLLLAEDNDTDVALFRRAVTRLGDNFKVDVVEDGEKAIAYLQGEGEYADRIAHPFPDFLLLDLKMPRKNGFEVLAWLREHPDCYVVPTIIFTASEIIQDIEQAYKMGANTYFSKPNDFHQLVDLLKSIVNYWSQAKHPRHPPGDVCR